MMTSLEEQLEVTETSVSVRKCLLNVMMKKKLVDVIQDMKSRFGHEGRQYTDIDLAQANRATQKAYVNTS